MTNLNPEDETDPPEDPFGRAEIDARLQDPERQRQLAVITAARDREQERERELLNGPHIVVTGNPVDGLGFTGPFPTADDATAWAEANAEDYEEWWTAPLETIEEEPDDDRS